MASLFVEELQRILDMRGMTWRKLAELTGYHPSWLSKIRNGRPPPPEVVRRCDEVLGVGGRLIALAQVSDPNPAQLPAAPAQFVGRASELAWMRDTLLGAGPAGVPTVVVVDGPPGVGKTATAVRCAHDIKGSGESAYRDGQLFADLRGFSRDRSPARPEDVLEDFLITLGTDLERLPASFEQRIKIYRTLLASRNFLVVLDNAASSGQVEPLLPGSAGCGVLVTSRSRLAGLAMDPGVVRIPLAPLAEPQSVELLRTFIGTFPADREPVAVAALAVRCGGLPLALRIAAERAAAHLYRPVSDLVEELDPEDRRLDALTTDDSVTLRNAFAGSYRNLDGATARVYRLLGLHRGPSFSVAAAAALAGLPAVRTRQLLEKLAGVHLLEAAPAGQYRFHDLLRLYARERCMAEDEAEDRRDSAHRLADWYVHTAYSGRRLLAPFGTGHFTLSPLSVGVRTPEFGDAPSVLRWFDAEAPNAPSVAELAVEHRRQAAAWRWGMALWDYFRLLRVPGRLWTAAQDLGLQAARAVGNRRAERSLLIMSAEARRWLCEYDRAEQLLGTALELCREAGDCSNEARALAAGASLAADRGRLDEAHQYSAKSLAIFQGTDDGHGQGTALLALADSCAGWHRPDEVLPALRDALRIFQDIGYGDGVGQSLVRMAQFHHLAGEHQEALRCADRALEERRRAGSRWGELDGLARRGWALRTLGRTAEAKESWDAAAALHTELDDPLVAGLRSHLRSGDDELIRATLSKPVW